MLSSWDIRRRRTPLQLAGPWLGLARNLAPLLILLLMLVGSLPVRAAAPADDLVKAELDCRARGRRVRRAVLGRPAPAHQGALARLLAQPRRFRGSRRHRLAAAAGLSADPIVWPTPSASPSPTSSTSATSARPTLLTRITPPATIARGAPVDLKADVTWLVCEKECIPGEASLSLSAARSPAPAPPQRRSADPRRSSRRRARPCRSPRRGPRAWKSAPTG